MDSSILFVPDIVYNYDTCYLYGKREYCQETKCCVFYVLEVSSSIDILEECDLIGVCNENSSSRPHLLQDRILLKRVNGDILVDMIVINNSEMSLSKALYVLYDMDSFLSSELLINCKNAQYDGDSFKQLAHFLKSRKSCTKRNKSSNFALRFTILILTSTLYLMGRICMIVKYSTFALHFKDCLNNLLCVAKSFTREKCVSLHSGNYLLASVIDMIVGALILHSLPNVDEIFLLFSRRAENVIHSITILVEWLMGSPAGLKLNHPLNQIIGGFFLYNINLWWTFLGIVEPVLKYGFYILSKLGFLGFSYQIAILADLFILVTFHVYCIYVYAARLYRLQVQGLWSLSKLVIGKKRNPKPGRVDSCPYTSEQLFVGTISFTVLLFLLPTILVYYVVFVAMRLGVVGVCGLMNRTRYFLQIFPAYSSLVWLLCPRLTAMTVRLDAKSQDKDSGVVCWQAKAIPVSWLETIISCIPQSVTQPPAVQWSAIIHNITTGKLIYPF